MLDFCTETTEIYLKTSVKGGITLAFEKAGVFKILHILNPLFLISTLEFLECIHACTYTFYKISKNSFITFIICIKHIAVYLLVINESPAALRCLTTFLCTVLHNLAYLGQKHTYIVSNFIIVFLQIRCTCVTQLLLFEASRPQSTTSPFIWFLAPKSWCSCNQCDHRVFSLVAGTAGMEFCVLGRKFGGCGDCGLGYASYKYHKGEPHVVLLMKIPLCTNLRFE